MFSKRLLAKRDLKNAQMNDYLTEDNKYFFNMLKKQPETLKKKYNLRKKEEIKEAKSDIFARFESDEVQRSSTALYKLVESFKQEDSKKSKVPQITDCDENLKSINKTPQDGFIWSELLHTLRSKHAPKPEQNKLKRKYEAVKSTTITSDGEHSDDSIIEISSKKIDSKKDVCYLGTKQTYPQNQNIPQVDQQTLSLLKKLNADIIQENSKFMCSQMNFNSNNIFPGFPNFQNLSFPLQNNNIQNNPLLQNLRLALNNNSLYSNLNSLPQILNQQLYPSNNFSQFWNNYQNSNSILQAKLNNLNLMNTMKTTPNYNWSSLMTLLQQNGGLSNI